ALGALLVPGSLSLITANFSGVEQGRAFGIWAGASAGTTLLGPFLGGFLVDAISWRAAFLINVPLIAVAIWATLVHVPESRDEQASPHFDWLGAAIVALAVGGLTFGAIFGQQREWRDPIAFVALAIGALALIAFPFQMRRARNPLVPLEMFRSRNFTVTNLSTFVIYGALYVAFYYMPLLSQGTLGYTAAAAGLAFVPGTIFMVFFSRRFGSLAARYGPRWFMAVGPAAGRRPDLHRDHRELLCRARVARTRHVIGGRAQQDQPAEPADRGLPARGGGGAPGIDRRLPPGHAGGGGPARGRRGDQRGR